MGGEPRTALSILAFPSETLDGEIMHRMLAGAMETLGHAGVALIGGHSIKDEEIKLGFAITGVIDPAAAAALDNPRAGDILVLTKPLGTGVLAFCQQIGRPSPAGVAAAEISMAALNKAAAAAMRAAGASACTDITGFGLFGHLPRLLDKLSARIYAGALPAFEGAIEALRQGVIPGAVERNRDYAGGRLRVAPGVDEARVNLGFDAQTSGGLLIAIAPEKLGRLLQLLGDQGVNGVVIGKLEDAGPGQISVEPGGANCADPQPAQSAPAELSTSPQPPHSPDCCADAFAPPVPAGSAAEAQRAFGAFMRAVQAPGALDARAKELILLALVIQSRCAPCFDAHRQKALEMGITQAEIDEAAWCAIAMGGAPVKMFYQECVAKK
jgi:selenide,water dikinase